MQYVLWVFLCVLHFKRKEFSGIFLHTCESLYKYSVIRYTLITKRLPLTDAAVGWQLC